MKSKLLLCLFFVAGLLLSTAASAQNRTVTGLVTDEGGAPLAGASVSVGGSAAGGVSTGADGRFSISVPASATALSVTFVGFDEGFVSLSAGVNNYTVTMYAAALEVGTVVVNAGIIQREAATFTGSYSQFSQEDLKEAGTLNVLDALSTLDPSFVIVDNNLLGSDPNSLPNIELNGKTSMTVQGLEDEYAVNPNLPHFVIDGFDSTLQEFMDLDINRIASAVILKDAGSTAIYGSKGANGVIVVETVKPKPGELQIYYSLNGTVSFADLSAYNLMNAAEKVEFERLAGFYGERYDNPRNNGMYFDRLERVESGIDTYWLKYPVRTGLSHQHRLEVSGGDDALMYQAAMGYNNKVGVMKGSNHEVIDGNVFLQYRKGDLNISNNMLFSSTISHTGSYGSFQQWANMSPYYKPYDDEGNLMTNVNDLKGIDDYSTAYVANPLYNASLDTDNVGKAIKFTNRTNFNYNWVDKGIKFNGGLNLTRTSSSNENFKDPRHSDFRTVDFTRKGTYQYANSNGWQWSGNISAAWTRTLGENHNITLQARAEAANNNSWGSSYSVEGLPEGAKPNPANANYPANSHPTYNTNISRNVSFLGTFNYNYAQRYLFDATVERGGSTAFGRENPFNTSWSLGAGWNISREKFAENWTWADNLKIRGSIGTNTNISNQALSSSIYNYMLGSDYFGQAWNLGTFANPYLDWQITKKISVGLDISLLDNRLNTTIDYTDNTTDPLTLAIPQPSSTGTTSYEQNLGWIQSKGWTASATYAILRKPETRTLFTVRASAGHNKQEYGGFGAAFTQLSKDLADALDIDPADEDAMEKISNTLNNNNMFKRYYDGADPDALWAVKSLGIDPTTGMELFRDKEGRPTFIYDGINDAVVIATTRAKVKGTFGFTFNHKHFRSSANFSYSVGGYEFNRALYARVENIMGNAVLNNQDRRALYDRWQKPGDVAEFKSIVINYGRADVTSSRFIQKNNYIEATSIQVGWDFAETNFIERLKMKSLLFTASVNNLFRISTIKTERGLEYPFARNVTFSLSTSF